MPVSLSRSEMLISSFAEGFWPLRLFVCALTKATELVCVAARHGALSRAVLLLQHGIVERGWEGDVVPAPEGDLFGGDLVAVAVSHGSEYASYYFIEGVLLRGRYKFVYEILQEVPSASARVESQ